MHSNACIMLRKLADTMPFGSGAFRVFSQSLRGTKQSGESLLSLNTNLSINLFINQINSL
jgi:hypothetical protein